MVSPPVIERMRMVNAIRLKPTRRVPVNGNTIVRKSNPTTAAFRNSSVVVLTTRTRKPLGELIKLSILLTFDKKPDIKIDTSEPIVRPCGTVVVIVAPPKFGPATPGTALNANMSCENATFLKLLLGALNLNDARSIVWNGRVNINLECPISVTKLAMPALVTPISK